MGMLRQSSAPNLVLQVFVAVQFVDAKQSSELEGFGVLICVPVARYLADMEAAVRVGSTRDFDIIEPCTTGHCYSLLFVVWFLGLLLVVVVVRSFMFSHQSGWQALTSPTTGFHACMAQSDMQWELHGADFS